jgi:hypothetical protein
VSENVVAQFIGLPPLSLGARPRFNGGRALEPKQSAPTPVIARLTKSVEAISWGYEIATPSTHGAGCWARNDKKRSAW